MRHYTIVIIFIIFIGLTACQSKNEYYIDPPKDDSIKWTDEISLMSGGDAFTIEDYIPAVIKWYNHIDISKPVSIDFVDDEMYKLGTKLTETKEVKSYIEHFMSGGGNGIPKDVEAVYKALTPVNRITYQIADIMMTSTIKFGDSNGSTIKIAEEDWLELRDIIIEARDFYYEK